MSVPTKLTDYCFPAKRRFKGLPIPKTSRILKETLKVKWRRTLIMIQTRRHLFVHFSRAVVPATKASLIRMQSKLWECIDLKQLPRNRGWSSTSTARYSRSRKSRKKSSKFKFDIMTNGARGHGHERQTLLSFDGDRKAQERKRRSRSVSRSAPAGPSCSNQFSDQEHQVADVVEVDRDHRHKRSWKEREKARRARAKTQGVWIFTHEGQGVSTGRRRHTAFVTIDLEDEGFHRALAPISDSPVTGWSRKFRQPNLDYKLLCPIAQKKQYLLTECPKRRRGGRLTSRVI